MPYLDLLQPEPSGTRSPGAAPRLSYLAQLRQPAPKPNPLPPGSLAGRTQFALAYNALLPQQRRSSGPAFSCVGSGQSRRPLYDGREIDIAVLVELAGICAKADIEASIHTIRRAAMALA
jgi:hypothetical protein